MDNPFHLQHYFGPSTFCDRGDELSRLVESAQNQRSIMLHSMRRLGKTGLIHHLQHHLTNQHKYICIYLDILDTTSDSAFVSQFISTCINKLFTDQSNILSKVTQFFGRYRPRFSIDMLTGNPIIELDINTQQEIDLSLEATFKLLNDSKKKIHIAIDEFQQIGTYDSGTRIDATIRKHLSSSKNIRMLFSGSQRHLLLQLFNDPKKPMFRLVEQMELYEIPYPAYSNFIIKMFNKGKVKIDERVVHLILQWTRSHTFYTHYICNRLYSLNKNVINEIDLLQIQHRILKEMEMNFLSYRNILSTNQYKVLKAIAKETTVKSVLSKDFTTTYGLASSTARQSLNYLVDTELVYEKLNDEGKEYFVYDLFFSKWLENRKT